MKREKKAPVKDEKQVCKVIDEEIKKLQELLCSFECRKCRAKS